jgi:hypothetical protein
MAGTSFSAPASSDDFSLICEGLFEPWYRASPAAIAAASAAAAKKKEEDIEDQVDTGDWRTWEAARQLRISKAISAAPWKRPRNPYLDAGSGSASSRK